jgi:hypothetical protein
MQPPPALNGRVPERGNSLFVSPVLFLGRRGSGEFKPTNISNRHLTTKNEPSKNESVSTNQSEDITKMKCSRCRKEGHRTDNKKFHPAENSTTVPKIETAQLPTPKSSIVDMEHVMSGERLAKQKEFIDRKLETSKQFDKYGLTLVDTNLVIISSLMGELRNIVLSFFKSGMYSVKKCEHCGTESSKQFERAHSKGVPRNKVALYALNRIRPDETVPIKQSCFIRAFIEEHTRHPLWILCKDCHKKYDASV